MKRTLCILLALSLVLGFGAAAFAADGPDSETVSELPGSTQINIVLSATLTGRYEDDVTDGPGDIDEPDIEAHVPGENVPEGAVRLVVVPIYDPDALAWFSGCAGEHWSDTGVFYAVFYEDADGNRLPAFGMELTVTVPGGYENLKVCAVSEAGSASSLDYQSSGASVTFTTDGSLYYGVVHHQGVLDEETDVGPDAPDTTLDTPVGELADDLLTDEEREYLDEGFDIHIKLTVDDITGSVDPADVSAVASVAGDYTAGEYIDIELLKQIGDSEWTHIYETNKPLLITVQILDRLLGHTDYAIVRVHDGAATFLPDLDSDPATITFETSLFSTFAIMYHGGEPAASPAPTVRPGEVPPTGDSADITPWTLLLAASLTGLAVVLVNRKNKGRSCS